MKDILENKIDIKNKEISRLAEKLRKETIDLIKIHKERAKHQEKEYKELTKVVAEKTSLPEDVEALKVFHEAFLRKEEELKKERVYR